MGAIEGKIDFKVEYGKKFDQFWFDSVKGYQRAQDLKNSIKALDSEIKSITVDLAESINTKPVIKPEEVAALDVMKEFVSDRESKSQLSISVDLSTLSRVYSEELYLYIEEGKLFPVDAIKTFELSENPVYKIFFQEELDYDSFRNCLSKQLHLELLQALKDNIATKLSNFHQSNERITKAISDSDLHIKDIHGAFIRFRSEKISNYILEKLGLSNTQKIDTAITGRPEFKYLVEETLAGIAYVKNYFAQKDSIGYFTTLKNKKPMLWLRILITFALTISISCSFYFTYSTTGKLNERVANLEAKVKKLEGPKPISAPVDSDQLNQKMAELDKSLKAASQLNDKMEKLENSLQIAIASVLKEGETLIKKLKAKLDRDAVK